MPDLTTLRVSDAERESAIEDLREHTGEGRLTAEELDERIDRAYAAKTRAELDAVRADLPVSTAAARREQVQRRRRLRRRVAQEAVGGLTLSGVSVAIWAASGASGGFWPIWVMVFTLLPLLRDSWRLLGPGADLEAIEARMQRRHEKHVAREERRRMYRRLGPPL